MACSSQRTKNTCKMSPKSPSMRRTSWSIGYKKRLAEEAKKNGIRATARNHYIPYSVLSSWVLQDFSDLPNTMKRMPGGGRPLKYV